MKNKKSDSFNVLTWNVQGTRNYTYTEFRDVAPVINSMDPDIMCLQEMPNAAEKILKLKNVRLYKKCISKLNGKYIEGKEPVGKYNYNIILSKFPIKRYGEIEFPFNITRNISENILWADIYIHRKTVRVYNCHLTIIGAGISERIREITYILRHAKKIRGPIIICGDMNTTIPKKGISRRIVQWLHNEPDVSMNVNGEPYDDDEKYLFSSIAKENGFKDAISINSTTWALPNTGWEIFNLKLDWFLMKKIKSRKVTIGKYISDHRPILVNCQIQ